MSEPELSLSSGNTEPAPETARSDTPTTDHPAMVEIVIRNRRAQPFFGRHPWVFAGAVDQHQGTTNLNRFPPELLSNLSMLKAVSSRGGSTTPTVEFLSVFIHRAGSGTEQRILAATHSTGRCFTSNFVRPECFDNRLSTDLQ